MTLQDRIRTTRRLLGDALAELDDIERRAQQAEVSPSAWLDYDGAAEYLGVSKASLYKLVERGRIKPSGKNGRYVRFRREDLDRFMAGGDP
jgi:excisionase family DNA binding protein